MRESIPLIKTRVCCLFLFLLLLALCVFFPTGVRADGGAPDLAYVAGASQGIGIIDVAQQKVARRFAVTGDPRTILLSPDGRLLYVTQPAAGRVVALAAKTGQTACTAQFPGHPSLLALSIDGTLLYVAGTNEATILALDAQSCRLRHSFQNAEPVSWLATISGAQGTQLWIAGTTSVSIANEQGQVSASIPVRGTPRFLSLPNNLTAYVATAQGDIVAIDMQTEQVFDTVRLGGTFGAMDYNAATQEIYVPDMQHNEIDVLAPLLDEPGTLPHEPERVIHLNGVPQSIAITFDGQLGFVALSGGQVAMLDIPGRSLVATISVGGQPHFIITGPYPPAALPPVQQENAARPNLTSLALAATGVLVLAALAGASWLVWQQRKKWLGR